MFLTKRAGVVLDGVNHLAKGLEIDVVSQGIHQGAAGGPHHACLCTGY